MNPLGYTGLVLLAVLSSQAAGAWLERALRRGQLLLGAPPASEGASADSSRLGGAAPSEA